MSRKPINPGVTCKTIIGLPYNTLTHLFFQRKDTQEEPFTVSDVDFTRALYIREAVAEIEITSTSLYLPACRRLLFPLLHAVHGRLRNAVANRVQRPASRVFYFA